MFAPFRPQAHPRFLASAATLLAVLAASLYSGVWRAGHPGEAAFPGANGKIVFSSVRDGNDEIYVMNSDGSNPVRLTFAAGLDVSPAVSPDGAQIAFATTISGGFDIFLMDIDGSNLTQLTVDPSGGDSPSWSPDGEAIVFQGAPGGNLDIYAINVDGAGLTQLTNDPASDFGASWSPNGDKIAFVSYRDDPSPATCFPFCNDEIYVMNSDGSGVTRLTDNSFRDNFVTWSPDGTRLSFVSTRDDPNPTTCFPSCNLEIYSMNPDGSAVTRLTDHPAREFAHAWSPDGTKIAFETDRDDENPGTCATFDCNLEIYSMNSDGSGAVRLTVGPSRDQHPDWQPVIATPTPTPLRMTGDADCDHNIDSVDALFVLRHVADLGDSACIDAGNVKCDDGLTAVDSLFILRYVAQLTVNLPDGCAPIGSE